jgi:uncharacterized protein (TIGR03084 family)
MTPYEQLLADLAAEQAALDTVLTRMTEAQWDLASPSPGWLVRDQVTHLAHFDEAATLAITDADAFRADAVAARASVDRGTYEARYLGRGRAMKPSELRAWWRGAGERLLAAARPIDPKARLPWYGPEMGAATFVTARLMETWSHGLDVVDAVGIPRPDTDRLRHVVFLGIRTREFSYVTRGLAPDTTPVYVELTAPSGATWAYGDTTAANRIAGARVISAVWSRNAGTSPTRISGSRAPRRRTGCGSPRPLPGRPAKGGGPGNSRGATRREVWR